MCGPSLVRPVLCCVRGQHSLCAWAGGLRKSGRDVALLGVTPSVVSLRFSCLLWPWHRLSCRSEWRWPRRRRERQGRWFSALLTENARMKRAVRILFPGRVCGAHADLVPWGPVPVGATSSGNVVEGEGRAAQRRPSDAENAPSDPGRGQPLCCRPGQAPPGEGVQAADPGSR